jgi:hypothetical protein
MIRTMTVAKYAAPIATAALMLLRASPAHANGQWIQITSGSPCVDGTDGYTNSQRIAQAGGPLYVLGCDETASGLDNHIWQFFPSGNAQSVCSSQTTNQYWCPADAGGGGWAATIAAAPDTSNHWAVNSSGGIYKYFASSRSYSPVKTGCADSIGVGPNDDVWVTGCGAHCSNHDCIYEGSGCGGNNGSCTWTQRGGSSDNAAMVTFDAASGGTAWIINGTNDTVKKWTGTAWSAVTHNGLPNDVLQSLSVWNGTVCVTAIQFNHDNPIYCLAPGGSSWSQVSPTSQDAYTFTVSGQPFTVTGSAYKNMFDGTLWVWENII